MEAQGEFSMQMAPLEAGRERPADTARIAISSGRGASEHPQSGREGTPTKGAGANPGRGLVFVFWFSLCLIVFAFAYSCLGFLLFDVLRSSMFVFEGGRPKIKNLLKSCKRLRFSQFQIK